jgi:hypothetical protein
MAVLLTNTFRIPLLDTLTVPYSWVRFDGLQVTDVEYDENVSLLATILGRKLQAPVAPVWRDEQQLLAVASTGATLPEKVNLRGAVTKLSPESETRTLRLAGGTLLEQQVAKKFLRWELRSAFYHDRRFWEHYGRQAERVPMVIDGYNGPVGLHRTLAYGFVPTDDGRFELSVEVGLCYLARRSLHETSDLQRLNELKFERCLYKLGLDWYVVDVSGPTRRIVEIEFFDDDVNKVVGLRSFIQHRWSGKGIPQVDALSDGAPALYYKKPQGQNRWAPASLLYPVYSTDSPEGAEVHRRAISAPHFRRKNIERAVQTVFAGKKIFGQPMRVEPIMRQLPEMTAPLPRLAFGGDTELTLTYDNIADARWDALRAPGVGPHVKTPFDPQYAVVPSSMPARMTADALLKLDFQVQKIYSTSYKPKILLYDDRSPRLSDQLREITSCLKGLSGYALVVLPKTPNPKLYTHLKRRLTDLNIQSQFAKASAIGSFYHFDGRGSWTVPEALQSRYASYMRHLALGVLAVNRKWLWRLADGTLSQQAYIGIDVLKGTAVFTFLYADGSDIYFQIEKSGRQERLSRDLVRNLLLDRVPKDIERLGLTELSCIVIYRDGKLCTSERLALKDVAQQLIAKRAVHEDFAFKVIEVHKSSAYHPRLFAEQNGRTYNPRMGTYRIIRDAEAILCTTGEPLLRQGTADPVHLVSVLGQLNTFDVVDFNALSHLGFTSPAACHRLAFPLALADHILRERQPERAEEQPWDDELDTAAELHGAQSR